MTAPRYAHTILEEAIGAVGGSVVTLTRTRAQLLFDLYNLANPDNPVDGFSSEEKALRAFYTLIVGQAPAASLSFDKLMAGVAGVSAATVGGPALWQAFADAVVSFTPVGGGGGGGGYTTGAVAFDGATYLLNAALAASNSANLSFSVWFRWPVAPTIYSVLFIVDPNGSYEVGSSFDTAEDGFNNFIGTDNNGVNISLSGGPAQQGSVGDWHNWLYSSSIAGTPAGQLLLDGVDVTHIAGSAGTAGVASFSGLPIYVGDDTFGSGLVADLADLWISTESLLVDGVIPPATIAKFMSGGKPVDLGSDGSTPTGTAPAVFLRAAPGTEVATFPTNLGTGGDFAVTGALTVAPSSPSD